MKPTWTRREGAVHLNYELPLRVHTAQIYPIRAPNGSSIIIYGHERGLTVVWRGGRPFKRAHETGDARKDVLRGSQPASSNNAFMIIDSDEEDSPKRLEEAVAAEEVFAFDSEDEEHDPSEPYDKIIDTLDIPTLGTSVLHFAVPSIPSDADKRVDLPPLFVEQMVLAAVCGDSSLRLFSIHLAPSPASPERQEHQLQGERVQEIIISEAQLAPRNIPRGVSMTWTANKTLAVGLGFEDSGVVRVDTEARGRSNQTSSQARIETTKWSLLVASHSAEAGGILSVYQCSLRTGNSQLSKASPSLLQREFLHNPATTISFSSSHYPSKRHTQLLVADSKGAVRVYDPWPRPRLHSSRLPTDFEQNSARIQGVWLVSLFSPFEESRSSSAMSTAGAQRIRILDAQWAVNGTCIVVLLADEQWGLWDIEGVGPTGDRTLMHNDANGIGMGLSAGSVTRFALRGFVGHSADARLAKSFFKDSASLTNSSARGSGRLAPMTPNTRKAKQQQLFNGPAQTPSSISGLVRGGISLSAIPSTTSGNISDESFVLWYGSSVFAIPSLMTYWQRVAKSSGKSHDTVALLGPNITQVTAISSTGEMISSVSQQPHRARSGQPALWPVSTQQIQHDLLVSTEHRLLMLCPTKGQDPFPPGITNLLKAEDANSDDSDAERLDQDLLRREALDIQGLDRFLDGMTNGNSTRNLTLGNTARGRRVGFAAGY